MLTGLLIILEMSETISIVEKQDISPDSDESLLHQVAETPSDSTNAKAAEYKPETCMYG